MQRLCRWGVGTEALCLHPVSWRTSTMPGLGFPLPKPGESGKNPASMWVPVVLN